MFQISYNFKTTTQAKTVKSKQKYLATMTYIYGTYCLYSSNSLLEAANCKYTTDFVCDKRRLFLKRSLLDICTFSLMGCYFEILLCTQTNGRYFP